MIDFPAIWVWYGFVVLSCILLFVALSQVINGIRHGSRMPLNIFVSGIFVLGVATMIVITLSLLNTVDWSTTYSIVLPSASFFRLGI